ncbi:specifically androgen-regulated gene protein-like [Ambystoma mexicanum]|uniref:specifically androgen-regulated gene protein-like n=1 Tax=Ambystoma mexicanum TaxID=8296 RepID=UPI0037E83BC8
MPEKALGSVNAGMASAVSVGSCDSVASISSNHSALSDDCYEYLSAEQRDVLMYLEETIESLDADGDSGLSVDDSERFGEAPAQREKSASQDIIHEAPRKTVDPPFKHGPLTHPKPLKLRADIIVKTSNANNNLEPQKRYRTRSVIDKG